MRVAKSEDESKNRLKFIQLGILANQSSMMQSPLTKFRSISKINDKTNKRYHVGIVLRENGRFEVYSDFILVNEYYNHQLQCIDISTDFNSFFLKFVENSHQVTRDNADLENL